MTPERTVQRPSQSENVSDPIASFAQELQYKFNRKFSAKETRYALSFADTQKLINDGKIDEAQSMFGLLEKDSKYLEFEADNEEVLSWIRELSQSPSSN